MFQIRKVSSPSEPPVFAIGELTYMEGSTPCIILVTATMSRVNSLKAIGGYHIALATEPSLSWADGVTKGFFASSLLLVFEQNARATLRALLPRLSDEEVAELAYSIGGNTEHTANRNDLHAHVPFAPIMIWHEKLVKRMVDDARPPRVIATRALELANLDSNRIEDIVNQLYLPTQKK